MDTAALPVLPNLSAPAFVAKTRTDQLALSIGATGTTTLQQAIDIFSISMAALPGESASTLPGGEGFSPTTALWIIQAHRSELTPAQKGIVDSFTAGIPGGTFDSAGNAVATPPGPTTTPGHRFVSLWRETPQQAHDDALFAQTIKDWKAYHPEFGYPAYSTVYSSAQYVSPANGGNALMAALVDPANPGTCVVTIYPEFTDEPNSDAYTKIVFAHELFHCFQSTWIPAGQTSLQTWLVEGSASFAARDLYRHVVDPATVPAEDQQWFDKSATPLSATSYQAWALFEEFRQQYDDEPYPNIEKMFKAGAGLTTAQTLAAGGFDNKIFENLWSSASLRSSSVSDAAWITTWPGTVPAFGPHDNAASLGAAGALILAGDQGVGHYDIGGQPNFSHQLYSYSIAKSVGLIGVVTHGGPMMTQADSGTVSLGEGEEAWFCVDSQKCVCPPDTTRPTGLIDLTPPMIFSFAAQPDATVAHVDAAAWDPDEYCKKEPPHDPSPPVQPVQSGGPVKAASNGDPHLDTFNGLTYDFMALGEYVTTSDPQGGLTVQERQVPAGFGVAVSAVAIATGDHHRLTFTASALGFGAPVVGRLDGVVTTAPIFSAGAVSVRGGNDDWVATWPDGSTVDVSWRDGFFTDVAFSPERAARAVGLLGRAGPNFLSDQMLPDGSRAVPGSEDRSFAKAWLVTDATTLFDYEKGQNTETFRSAAALPVAQISAAAISTCRQSLGTAATTFEVHSCAYDVAATGQTRFTQVYRQVTQQRLADQGLPTGLSSGSPSPTSGATPVPTLQISSPPAPTTDAGPGATPPVLTLSGVITSSGSSDVPKDLTGTVTLKAGTVLLSRTICPADPSTEVGFDLTDQATQDDVSVRLCPDVENPITVHASDPTADVPVGEDYILVLKAGTYQIQVEGSPGPAPTSVSFFSDSTPTAVSASSFAAAGYSGTLSGTGDTVVIPLTAAAGAAQWSIDGSDVVCEARYDTPSDTATAVDMGGVCDHQKVVYFPPGGAQTVPIVLFDRRDISIPVTVTKTN